MNDFVIILNLSPHANIYGKYSILYISVKNIDLVLKNDRILASIRVLLLLLYLLLLLLLLAVLTTYLQPKQGLPRFWKKSSFIQYVGKKGSTHAAVQHSLMGSSGCTF